MGGPLPDVAEERSVKFHDECEAMLMAKEVGVAEKSGAHRKVAVGRSQARSAGVCCTE